jgi:hypothetical protein
MLSLVLSKNPLALLPPGLYSSSAHNLTRSSQPVAKPSQKNNIIIEMPQGPMDMQMANNEHFKFLHIQTKLYEVLHLLHSAYEESSKHRCYSRDFEIAYWQENKKLKEAISTNKRLAQQLEERAFGSIYSRPEPNQVLEDFRFEPFSTGSVESTSATPGPEVCLTENDQATTTICTHEDEEQQSVILESCEKDELSELEKYIRLN